MNINSLIAVKRNPKIPELAPGDTVRVYTKVVEGDKERTQPFQGVVIKMQGGGIGATFTVRRIAYGVGVERTFPLQSPRVDRVEVIRHGKVRRAKLYYLRGRSGRAARIRERRLEREKELAQMGQPGMEAEEEEVPAEAEVAAEPEEALAEAPAAAAPEGELSEEAKAPAEPEKAEPEVTQAKAELAPEEPEAAPAKEKPEAKSQE